MLRKDNRNSWTLVLTNKTNKIAQVSGILIAAACLMCLTAYSFRLYSKYSIMLLTIYFAVMVFALSHIIIVDKLEVTYTLLILAYFIFAVLFTNGGVGSIFAPIASMALIIVIKNCRMSLNIFLAIKVLFVFIFLMCLIKCRSYFVNWDEANIESFNPNTLGFLTAYSSMFLLIVSKNTTKYLIKVFKLFFIFLTIMAIWQYRSRASLIMFLSFLIFKAIPFKLKKNRRFTLLIYMGILAIGILVPYIMTLSMNRSIVVGIPVLDKFFSKGFYTGRELIWNNFFIEMSKSTVNWIIGVGSHVNIMYNGETNINLHNIYLLILMNFGGIGFILYYGFYFLQIKRIFSRGRPSDFQINLIYGAFSFFILGVFETTSLWIPFILFMSILWGMAGGVNFKFLRKEWKKDGNGQGKS